VQLLVDAVVVPLGLGDGVRRAVEVVEGLGAVRLRLQQVVEAEAELAAELARLDVPVSMSSPPCSATSPGPNASRSVNTRPPTRPDAS
jgi:hypothetical protein